MFLVVDSHVYTFACVIIVYVFLSLLVNEAISMSLFFLFVCPRLVFPEPLFPAGKAVPGAGLVLLSTVLKYEHPKGDDGVCVCVHTGS